MKPARLDVHPADILASLKKLGTSAAAVSQRCGRNRNWAQAAINGTLNSEPAERAVAAALGTTPGALWPSRYTTRGRRIGMQSKRAQRAAA